MNNVFGEPYATGNGAFDQAKKLEREAQILRQLGNSEYGGTLNTSAIDELNSLLQSFSSEQLMLLNKEESFVQARNLYEQGFQAFLSTKFGVEYTNTPQGKLAIEKLINEVRSSKSRVEKEELERRKRVDALIEAAKSNPNATVQEILSTIKV